MAGIVTETNTFSPIPTGANIVPDSSLDGFRRKAAAAGDEVVFGLYAFAMPAGITVRKAYEDLRDELLGQLRAAMPVDAVFLPLHGAMVADGYDYAEGDLIERVRALVGPAVTIGVHVDLHCHLTQRMLDHCASPGATCRIRAPACWVEIEGDCVHLRVRGLAGAPSSGGDVDVIVTTRRGQVLGVEVFTAFGIDLATKRVVVVKAIQHFYAAFAPVAAEVVYMAVDASASNGTRRVRDPLRVALH